MNLQALRSSGIALLLAVGLVAWLALGVAEPAVVGAHDCAEDQTPPNMHDDFHGNACNEPGHDEPHENVIEVDGGRDRELALRFYPPENRSNYLDVGDKIEINLADFDLSDVDAGALAANIDITDSVASSVININSGQVAISTPNLLTLTLPNIGTLADMPGEFLIITINEGTGILAPEIPRGFDDPGDGYPIEITFLGGDGSGDDRPATDKNIAVVKNPVSSTVPGATVRVQLATFATQPIGGNQEIVVDFSGPSEDASFGLPTTIGNTRVTFGTTDVEDEDESVTFSPSDVLVQGDRVILTIPEDKIVAEGDFSIGISQIARIRNPFAAGNRIIEVFSLGSNYVDDEITAVIRRTTSVRPVEGPRGSQFTLEGKGYAQGTVTVFEAEAEEIGVDFESLKNPPVIDPGETLASVRTSRGSFTVRVNAGGEPGQPAYKVWTRDSNGAIHFAVFDIRSSMSFEPSTVGIGERLRITILDWESDHQEVAAVQIGGVQAFAVKPIEYTNCFEPDPDGVYLPDDTGTITLQVTVPGGVPPGDQTLAVYGHEQLELVDEDDELIENKDPCADLMGRGLWGGIVSGSTAKMRVRSEPVALVEKTVEIVAESLTLSPAAAARGQRITITGSGFSRNPSGRDDIQGISINGNAVAEDVSEFEVSTTGNFAFKVTVPLNAPIGDNEVRVEGWDHTLGQATLEVLGAAITLDRAESRRGTGVEFTGLGFIANERFQVWYGDGGDVFDGDIHLGSGRADASGGIEFEFDVPLSAPIGRLQKVTVQSRGFSNGQQTIVTAEAEHTVPAGQITTTPYRVSPGDLLTIRGEDMPAFALIRSIELEDRDITPVPYPSTNRDGEFEIEITVPQIEFGDLALRVDASGVLITHSVEVGPPPLSGDPAVVFKELIREGALVRIWRLEPSTQDWFFYDPREVLAAFNTLETVARETVVVLIVNQDSEFRGQPLSTGSNFVFVD